MNTKAVQGTWWGVAPSDSKVQHSFKETAEEWARFRLLSEKHHGLIPPSFGAYVLGVSRQRVYQMINEGKLESFTIFDRVLVPTDQIEDLACSGD